MTGAARNAMPKRYAQMESTKIMQEAGKSLKPATPIPLTASRRKSVLRRMQAQFQLALLPRENTLKLQKLPALRVTSFTGTTWREERARAILTETVEDSGASSPT